MKLFFDLFPIIVFFAAYKLGNLYIATGFAIGAVFLQLLITILRGKKPEIMHLITLAMITIFGGATLLFHNEMFIKWKPSVLYWFMGLLFLLTPYFTQKNLVQKLLEKSLALPEKAWSTLNTAWYSFFFIMGALNIVVVYTFSTDVWVNFKLFGTLGLTLIFGIVQAIIVSRYNE